MIWNDSYSYVKNSRIKSQNPSEFVEYEMIIKRSSTINTKKDKNSMKKGLFEDFIVN